MNSYGTCFFKKQHIKMNRSSRANRCKNKYSKPLCFLHLFRFILSSTLLKYIWLFKVGKHVLLGVGLYTEVFWVWGFLWERCSVLVGIFFFQVLTDNKISFPVIQEIDYSELKQKINENTFIPSHHYQ